MDTISNPFPGLRCFQPDEDYLFFGRHEQIEDLLSRLRTNRLAAVVGTSGSGKSSLVRAGLLPAILGGGMAQAGSAWEIAVMRPGGSPMRHLASALCEAGLYDPDAEDAEFHVQATLRRSRNGLIEAVRQSSAAAGSRLLLVVDQFEELFRFNRADTSRQEESIEFVNLLLQSAHQPDHDIYVVLTMRSDFLGECSQFLGLAEAVNDGEFLIPRMTRDQIQQAIEGPIRVRGAEIAPRLLFRLLNDVEDNQDQLPVLQHALMRTWDLWQKAEDRRRRATPQSDRSAQGTAAVAIDLEHYEATGGMRQALSRHADEVFEALLSDQHRDVTARIFKALTERGPDGRGIRRPTRLDRLTAIVGSDPATVRVATEAYRAPGITFLMPPVTTALEDHSVIDISHESLMRVWGRLRGWVEEEAQSSRIYRRLHETATLHVEKRAGLYHDPDLQIAIAWRGSAQPNAAWAEQYGGGFEAAMGFLNQSQEAADWEEKEREDARQRELDQAKALATAQRLRVLEQQRAARWLKGLVAAAASVAVAAIVAFFVARSARQAAERESQRAAASEAQVDQQAREFKRKFYGANLIKAKYWHEAGNGGRAVTALMDCPEDLHNWEWYRLKYLADQSEVLVEGLDQLILSIFSPDGSVILSSQQDGVYQLWDAATGRELWSASEDPLPFSPPKLTPAFSWDGKLVLTPGAQTLHVRESATGGPVKAIPGQFIAFYASSNRTVGLRLGAEPSIVDIHGENTAVALRDQVRPIIYAAFSSDGSQVAASDLGGNFQVWRTANGEKTHAFAGGLRFARAIAFSPDGSQLLGTDAFGNIKRWNTVNKQEIRPLRGHVQEVRTAAYSPDGTRIISGDATTLIKVWDVQTGTELGTLRGHASQVSSLHFSPNPAAPMIVSSSSDGTIRLWETEPVNPVMLLKHGPQNTVLRHLDFSPNGTLLATTGFDGQVRIWDVSAGKELANLPGNAGRCTAVDFSPDGTRLVSGHVNPGKVTLWNTETWEPIRNLQGPTQGIFWVTYSPNEELIAAAGLDRKIFLWDAQTGEPQPFPGLGLEEGNIDGLDFSPDSEWMGISFGGSRLGQVWIVDVATGEVIKRFQGPQSGMRQVAFSPDGTQLAAGFQQTKEILIWEIQTGELVQRLRGHREDVLSLAFSPDGNRVFTGGADDSVRVWDVGSGEELLLVDTLAGDSWGVAVSPDGRTVAAVHEFGDVYVWKTTLPPQTQRLQRIQEQQKKAARVQRLFTQGRWSELVPYYLRVVTEDFDNTEAHMQAAAVLSAAGDREGYREVCNRMIEHFSVQRSVALYLEAERTTKACLILPDVIEPSRVPLHGFADPMDNGDTPDWFFPFGALTRALVALRSGDPEEALRWAKDAEERSPTPIIRTDCKLVQAIAYHGLGRSSEAMDALAEGTSSLQDLSRVLEEQVESPSWHDWLYAQSLRREAAALVGQP